MTLSVKTNATGGRKAKTARTNGSPTNSTEQCRFGCSVHRPFAAEAGIKEIDKRAGVMNMAKVSKATKGKKYEVNAEFAEEMEAKNVKHSAQNNLSHGTEK